MSGIVGMINLDGAAIDRGLLDRLTQFIAHRGPDARATWSESHVGFGHTMLRTTDESLRERQPCTIDGRVWITADARVDGRADLVSKLARFGFDEPRAATDVDLILKAYLAWGPGCVDHLLGDYAFAIWDGSTRRLFCARDAFGVKPFFYAHVGNVLVFGNTLECVRSHPAVSNRLNDVAIGDFLLFGVNQDPATTTFADIQRLPGAHTMICEGGHVRTRRYWSLPVDGHLRYRDPRDYVEHFKVHLRTSVAERLRTNRISCEMSGGLDSTSIAATAKTILAQRGSDFDIRAHAIVYDRLIPDRERHFSGIAARALHIPIDYLAADGYSNFEPPDNDPRCEPEPFYIYPRHRVNVDFRQQMAAHSRVALTGWDGDALLCDSPRLYFRALAKDARLRELAAGMRWYVGTKRALPPIGVRTWLRRKLGTYPPKSLYPSWLDPQFASRANLRARWEQFNTEQPPVHPTRPMASQMLSVANWWYLLESYDPGVTGLTMEARHPLIDLRLVNYVLAIPPVPWCDEKHILRAAMVEVLPREILRRPKTALAGDPVVEKVRLGSVQGLAGSPVSSELERYVNVSALDRASRSLDPNALWQRLTPHCLDLWLDRQNRRASSAEAATRVRMGEFDEPSEAVQVT